MSVKSGFRSINRTLIALSLKTLRYRLWVVSFLSFRHVESQIAHSVISSPLTAQLPSEPLTSSGPQFLRMYSVMCFQRIRQGMLLQFMSLLTMSFPFFVASFCACSSALSSLQKPLKLMNFCSIKLHSPWLSQQLPPETIGIFVSFKLVSTFSRSAKTSIVCGKI